MIKRIQNWFIGAYLRKTPDIIEQARIILLYRILILTLILMSVVLPSEIIHKNYGQLSRDSVVILCFAFALFFLRKYHSVQLASRITMAIATAYLIANIYMVFQAVDGVSYLFSFANILIAFHFLKGRWAAFYLTINILAILVFVMLQRLDMYHIPFSPEQPLFDQYYVSMITIFILIITILWHFRVAFILSSKSLKTSLEEQKQLTQKYVQLSEELSIAKDKAEEMNRLKTNFLNNMSHEIRTPLNGILGIAQIIENETEDVEIKEYVRIQKQSGERLLNTITSILHLSLLEAQQPSLQFSSIEVNQLVEECFISLKAIALHKNINYHFSPSPAPLYAMAEAPLLHQVMNNLIGNAIKFTQSGSVTVSTGIFKKNPAFLFIRISDTGIGIAKEFLPHLFQPFLQESSGRDRKYEGSGLGLSIAKKYVELLGGDIMVESEKGTGSTFHVLLPLFINKRT